MFTHAPVHFTVVINLVLAFIPLVFAFYLFKLNKKRSVLWWFLALVFIAFLPNSAYVLTDIIHFIAAVKSPDISLIYLLLVICPFYIIFLTLNFEFYVLAISWAKNYINKQSDTNNSWHWLNIIFIPAIHLLSAVGVYLGRFQRLESTDILHKPLLVFRDAIHDIFGGSSALIIIVLFIIFYSLYFMVCRLNKRMYQAFKEK